MKEQCLGTDPIESAIKEGIAALSQFHQRHPPSFEDACCRSLETLWQALALTEDHEQSSNS